MNVTLWEEVDSFGNKITIVDADSLDTILFTSIPDLKKIGQSFGSKQCIGDCIIDLLYEDSINSKYGIPECIGTITVIDENDRIDFIYHSPAELIKLLLNKEHNQYRKYLIHLKETLAMKENRYHVPCPAFNDVDQDYRRNNTLRSYCHPVDEKIIKILDNPATNAVFRTISDFGADSSFGQMLASGIPINHNNYPEEDSIIRHCSERLGIRRPYAIISNQLPGINAMTIGSDDEPYLVLSSLLVKVLSRKQLEFVIGHECGHIAMGHVVYHSAVATAGSLSQLIPIIGPAVYKIVEFPLKAWERRSEITADRAGLICCEDLEVSQRTLLQLESAFQNAENLDIDAYIENSKHYLKKGTIRKLGEYTANHPLIAKRMDALRLFANSRCYLELTSQPISTDTLSNRDLEAATEEIIKVL